MPNSVKTAAGKARQRQRNQASGGGNPGSTGVMKQFMQDASYLEYEEVEDELVHVVDMMGIVTQTQMLANGVSFTVTCTPEYAHHATEIHVASRGQVLFLRAYMAPMSIFEAEEEDDEETLYLSEEELD